MRVFREPDRIGVPSAFSSVRNQPSTLKYPLVDTDPTGRKVMPDCFQVRNMGSSSRLS